MVGWGGAGLLRWGARSGPTGEHPESAHVRVKFQETGEAFPRTLAEAGSET